MLHLPVIGNTLNFHGHGIPKLSISEETVRFRSIARGERSYHTLVIYNHGETNTHYSIVQDDSEDNDVFRCYPTDGVLFPEQFQIVVLEFAPKAARNDGSYNSSYTLTSNFNSSWDKRV